MSKEPAPESMTFQCPHCGKPLRAAPSKAGRRSICPQCRQAVEVPAANRAAVPPAGQDRATEPAPTVPRSDSPGGTAAGSLGGEGSRLSILIGWASGTVAGFVCGYGFGWLAGWIALKVLDPLFSMDIAADAPGAWGRGLGAALTVLIPLAATAGAAKRWFGAALAGLVVVPVNLLLGVFLLYRPDLTLQGIVGTGIGGGLAGVALGLLLWALAGGARQNR